VSVFKEQSVKNQQYALPINKKNVLTAFAAITSVISLK
jgi:hypothetical protein